MNRFTSNTMHVVNCVKVNDLAFLLKLNNSTGKLKNLTPSSCCFIFKRSPAHVSWNRCYGLPLMVDLIAYLKMGTVIFCNVNVFVYFIVLYHKLPVCMHISWPSRSVYSNTGLDLQQCIMRSLYIKQLYLLAGWCSGALRGLWGAPTASNLHSCSPGLEPLQSPPVPPAIGTACPEGMER